ncbi:hypothetical protein B7R21_04805 [Subtercola boreus]|uniref:DUF3800 domain-containing protein n=1 Tax=Subtercola boreus TaxID=120213 RepID=A0A3E0W176_9MICO|nr:hypothetical protein B7R21_04805 [Subtercola boreus]
MAFVDESYETRGLDTFYVIGVAVVNHEETAPTRVKLGSFYGGQALHAAPMFANREIASLRQATELVAQQNDGLDVVVCAPIEPAGGRDSARQRCLVAAVTKVQRDFGSLLFVIDSLGTPTENQVDQHSFRDLRRRPLAGIDRDTVAVHCRPSEEILLGLPDVLAWAYRQLHVGRDAGWFEPLRQYCDVTML